MFSNARGAPAGGAGAAHMVEFKAGRSFLQPGSAPNKKKVVGEKTKGMVFVKQSNDQLIHFCWKNRETGAIVDDLIIFPGDTEFKEVKGCPDGQVFMLKFKSSDERRLFWVQDPEVDKDLCQKVNDALNKPPNQRLPARGGSSERSGGASAAAGLASISGSEELGALGGLDQQQLMQLLQFMNPGSESGAGLASESGATPGAAVQGGRNPVSHEDLSQLQQLLGSIKPNGGSRGGEAAVDLVDVITGERAAETVRNNQDRLMPHIPTSEEPKQELAETVHAPQFKQASSAFGHALQTGQMEPVLQQFGIPADAAKAAANGDLLEFAKKLTESEQGTSSDDAPAASAADGSASGEDSIKEPEPKRGKTDEDEMDLD